MENPVSVKDMISFSWKRSLEILASPETGKFFDFRRWFKILIIVWLAGAGGSSFRGNFSLPAKKTPKTTVETRRYPVKQVQTPAVASASSQSSVHATPGTGRSSVSLKPSKSQRKAPPFALPLIIGFVILGVVMLVFFMWVTCRFNFIFLDTLVKGNSAIREPFREHKEIGNSYFKWDLGIMGVSLGTLLLMGSLMACFFWIAKGNVVISVVTGVVGGLLILAAVLFLGFIGGVVHAFVTPIVYRDKSPIMATLKKVLKAETFSVGKVMKYAFVCLGLWILAAIAQGIVGILVGLVGLIAGGLVAIPGVFLVKALPFLKIPLIVLGGILAVALILAIIIFVGMVMLPVSIFFRVFSLTYLTQLYPDCDLLNFQKGGLAGKE